MQSFQKVGERSKNMNNKYFVIHMKVIPIKKHNAFLYSLCFKYRKLIQEYVGSYEMWISRRHLEFDLGMEEQLKTF